MAKLVRPIYVYDKPTNLQTLVRLFRPVTTSKVNFNVLVYYPVLHFEGHEKPKGESRKPNKFLLRGLKKEVGGGQEPSKTLLRLHNQQKTKIPKC